MENHNTSNSKDTYPLEVEYCGSCGLPSDLCIYFQNYGSCLEWLKKKQPDKYQNLLDETLRNLQQPPTPSDINLKINENNQYSVVGLSEKRQKNGKCLTTVTGLSKFVVNLKKASQCLAETLHCVTSIEDDNIVAHGAFKGKLYDLIAEKWEIDPFDIEDLDEQHPI